MDDDELSAEEEFDRFYRSEADRLAGALRLLCGDAALAEELAQEAMVRTYAAWDRVRELPGRRSWLYTTGFNLVRRQWRVGRRRFGDLPMSRLDAPEMAADRLALLEALERLPLRQRKAVVARFVLGHSTEEAAALLGTTPGALRALLHRALTSLRIAPALIDDRED